MNQLEASTIPDEEELWLLKKEVLYGDMRLTEEQKEMALQSIANCTDYAEYTRLKYKIERHMKDFDEIVNPAQKDINKHLRQFIYL